MFDYRTESDVAQYLSLQIVLLDNGLERGGHHLLVGAIGIASVCAAKRDAQTANDCDPDRPAIVPHHCLRMLMMPGQLYYRARPNT
jgi:hypothetical protein